MDHINDRSGYAAATRAIHEDDHVSGVYRDVAPPIHTATTFAYDEDPKTLKPVSEWEVHHDRPPDAHVYSRILAPNTTRLESVLSSLLNGRALTYSTGLSAFHALLMHLNPKRIAIGDGYHGCHGVLGIHQRLTGCQKVDLSLHADIGEGDLVHLETPVNPTGEAYDISSFARYAHDRGAFISVDATFAPPPLQDPFAHGADIVMHSGTKYIGGHSDMLCGVLVVQRDDWWWSLYRDRMYLGSVMGNLEGWLGLRSIRTLELRVKRQSQSATELVRRLFRAQQDNSGVVSDTVLKVSHASIQQCAPWLKQQMPNGYGPVFALMMRNVEMAKRLPSQLQLFHHATSLGGVESLIEWRRMSDNGVDERLMRLSIGIEDVEDLWADLMMGLEKVVRPA